MNAAGKKWVLGIGAYLIVKSILNLILGFGFSNVVMLAVSVAALALMLNRVPYINYVVAVWLALMFLMHLGNNIQNFSSQWLYLLEGILDIGAAAVLAFAKEVRSFFQR